VPSQWDRIRDAVGINEKSPAVAGLFLFLAGISADAWSS
jgi:hypothetical protein